MPAVTGPGYDGPRVPKVVVGLRGSGRTHALIEWLCHGEPIDGWPRWSRLLVVADPQTVTRLPREFPDLQHRLHGLGTGGLGKLVVYAGEVERIRGVDTRLLEVAVDDAEYLLGHPGLQVLPRPSVIAITGEAVTPAGLNQPRAEQVFSAQQMRRLGPDEFRFTVDRLGYDQRESDHDALYGQLRPGDPIRCLNSVGPDVGEQHCGQRATWLRGRPGILGHHLGEHPTHGWMGHESGWRSVRCPGGDRVSIGQPVRRITWKGRTPTQPLPSSGQATVANPVDPPPSSGPSVPPPEREV